MDPILIAEGVAEDSGCFLTDLRLDGADGHAHQKEQADPPVEVPKEDAESSPEVPPPHSQCQPDDAGEGQAEFSAPQVNYIIRHTLEQCCERLVLDIDIDDVLAVLAENVPILLSELEDLIASKSEVLMTVNSLCENAVESKPGCDPSCRPAEPWRVALQP